MQKLFSLLISDATAIGPDGKITLYGIFDVIRCDKLPLRHPQFSVYWKIYSEELGEISLKIKKPDESILLTTNPIKLLDNPMRIYQGIYVIGGAEFSESGNYQIILLLNNSAEIGSTKLIIQDISRKE